MFLCNYLPKPSEDWTIECYIPKVYFPLNGEGKNPQFIFSF